MDKYSGKTGNQVLQMAIEAKSFDEMKEHLEGLRYKQALDKSRLPELVETAMRKIRLAQVVPLVARSRQIPIIFQSLRQSLVAHIYWLVS